MNTLPIPLTSAVVLRGQRAWGRIKATAAEQRQLWKEVGEALMVGRKEHTSNQEFGKWCVEMGFDMDARVRSDAMWLAANWSSSNNWKTGDTHPTAIRTRSKDEPSPPAPEVDLSTSPAPRARLTIETAKKVNKLVAI